MCKVWDATRNLAAAFPGSSACIYITPNSTDQLSLLFQAWQQNTSLLCLLIYTQARDPQFNSKNWPAALDASSQDFTQEWGSPSPSNWLWLMNQVRKYSHGYISSSCSGGTWRYAWGLSQEVGVGAVRWYYQKINIQCFFGGWGGGSGVEWAVSYYVAQASLELSM